MGVRCVRRGAQAQREGSHSFIPSWGLRLPGGACRVHRCGPLRPMPPCPPGCSVSAPLPFARPSARSPSVLPPEHVGPVVSDLVSVVFLAVGAQIPTGSRPRFFESPKYLGFVWVWLGFGVTTRQCSMLTLGSVLRDQHSLQGLGNHRGCRESSPRIDCMQGWGPRCWAVTLASGRSAPALGIEASPESGAPSCSGPWPSLGF